MTRLTSLLWAIVALLLICLGTSWAIQRRSVAKAEAAESRAQVLGVERDAALDKANKEAAGRKAAEADLATARARVASARPRPTIPTVPAVPHSAAVAGADPTSDLVPALDDLVSRLDEKVASLERENGDLRLALDKSMKQTEALGTVIKNTPKPYNRGLGLIYGRDRGITGEYDFMRLRVGADAVWNRESGFGINARLVVRF